MSGLTETLSGAATVLGYFALVLVAALVLFVLIKLGRELAHDRARKKYEREEWLRAQSKWIFDDFENRKQDRYDTDIMDFPTTAEYEAVAYLQERKKHGRRKDRR